MAFPTTILPLLTEVLINGTWTDVTSRRRIADGLNITRGRGDWASRAVASRGDCVFDNADGYFSNRRADSPNYGLLGRNTQLRHRIRWYANTFTQSLATVGVTVSQAVAVSLRDFDITFDCTNPVVPTGNTIERGVRGRYVDASNYVDMRVFYNTANEVRVIVRQVVAGVETATSFVTVAPATTAALSVRFQAKGDRLRCKVWAAADPEPSAWTRTLTTTFLTVGTFVLYTVLTAGNTNTLPVVETWDDVQISDYRFWGEMSASAPVWKPKGSTGVDVTAPVEAAGILRRLGDQARPLRSPLYRSIVGVAPNDYVPWAYWPMEDGSDATQFASALPGGAAMTFTGASPAGSTGPSGSQDLASFPAGSSALATIPGDTAATRWAVQFAMKVDTKPAADTNYLDLRVAGSPIARHVVRVHPAGASDSTIFLDSFLTDGSPDSSNGFPVGASGNIPEADFYGHWFIYTIAAYDNGTDTVYGFSITAGGWSSYTAYTGTIGYPTSVTVTGAADTIGVGHLSVFTDAGFDPLTDAFANAAAINGWAGETAADRLARLCREERIYFDLVGTAADTALMGPQQVATLVDLLFACADSDQGILYEPRDALGLAYRTRVTLYNQTGLSLNYTGGQIKAPFMPVEDDQLTRNDVTVTRIGGSSARVEITDGPLSTQDPPAGVGTIDVNPSLNLYTDSQAATLAGWLAHLGTWDEPRFPTVTVDLAAPDVATSATLMATVPAVDLGDYLSVSNPPPWLPPDTVQLLAQGSREFIGDGHEWAITWNTVPAGPYAVGAYGDGVVRYDTDHTTTAEALDTTETGVDVTVAAGGAGWVTTAGQPAEFPFGIVIGGEDMTVTANTSTGAGTYTLTVTRSVNGIVKAHSTGAAVHVKHPGYYAY